MLKFNNSYKIDLLKMFICVNSFKKIINFFNKLLI